MVPELIGRRRGSDGRVGAGRRLGRTRRVSSRSSNAEHCKFGLVEKKLNTRAVTRRVRGMFTFYLVQYAPWLLTDLGIWPASCRRLDVCSDARLRTAEHMAHGSEQASCAYFVKSFELSMSSSTTEFETRPPELRLLVWSELQASRDATRNTQKNSTCPCHIRWSLVLLQQKLDQEMRTAFPLEEVLAPHAIPISPPASAKLRDAKISPGTEQQQKEERARKAAASTQLMKVASARKVVTARKSKRQSRVQMPKTDLQPLGPQSTGKPSNSSESKNLRDAFSEAAEAERKEIEELRSLLSKTSYKHPLEASRRVGDVATNSLRKLDDGQSDSVAVLEPDFKRRSTRRPWQQAGRGGIIRCSSTRPQR